MNWENIYTPSLTILSNLGYTFTSFTPDQETAQYLLHRTALESAALRVPMSYSAAASPGLGLLCLRAGRLQLRLFPTGQNTPPGMSSVEETISPAEGSLLLFRCDMPRRITVSAPSDYTVLLFDGHSIPWYIGKLLTLSSFFQWHPMTGLPSELLSLFENRQEEPLVCHLLLTKLLTQMILDGAAPIRKIPPYLKEIKKELETQYYKKHTLEQFERKYKINRYRICREFKEHYLSSPMQHLHKMRIQASAELLAETTVKIHEISYEVGYENVNHLIHHFKKILGCTPTEYRERRITPSFPPAPRLPPSPPA